MLKHFVLGLVLIATPSCGAYFIQTDELQAHHQEGVAPLGVWQAEDTRLVFHDGPDTHDRVCVFGEDTKIWADIHFVPVKSGNLVIVSGLLAKDEALGKETLAGYLIYLLQKDDTALKLIAPFDGIDESDQLPFAVACPFAETEGTLASMNFTPFCLSPGTTPDEVAAWVHKRSDIEMTALGALPLSQVPDFCRQK